MSRNRASAKSAGTRFERLVADYLRKVLADERIDRRVKRGRKDRGDIAGVRVRGKRCVIEAKDYAGRHKLPEWLDEAEVERLNDDAGYGIVAWKRRGVSDPAEQYVTMTLRTFAAICAGGPEYLEEEK